MPSPFAESPEFQRLLRHDCRIDLVRLALEIARDAYPGLDFGPYLGTIDALTQRVRERTPENAKPRQILGQINWVLFVEEGFHGDSENYYDPRNSYLNEVIDRKTGIPISLSILYWTLAERLGLAVGGVNLPAHFLLRVDQGESTVFVDAFHAGALLDRQGCERRVGELLGRRVALTEEQLACCRLEQVVARLLRNLKAIYFETLEYTTALSVQRRLAALARGVPEEQRDLGMLCLRLDRPAEAIEPLQTYLSAQPEAPDADAVREVLRTARRELALRN